MSIARSASKRSPVRNSARAFDGPIFARTKGEMTAGMMPSFISVKPKSASSLAVRTTSHTDASPDSAAERGAVHARDDRLARQLIDRAEHIAHAFGVERRSASNVSSSDSRIQLMSAPPQKTLPSPARTTARTSSVGREAG